MSPAAETNTATERSATTSQTPRRTATGASSKERLSSIAAAGSEDERAVDDDAVGGLAEARAKLEERVADAGAAIEPHHAIRIAHADAELRRRKDGGPQLRVHPVAAQPHVAGIGIQKAAVLDREPREGRAEHDVRLHAARSGEEEPAVEVDRLVGGVERHVDEGPLVLRPFVADLERRLARAVAEGAADQRLLVEAGQKEQLLSIDLFVDRLAIERLAIERERRHDRDADESTFLGGAGRRRLRGGRNGGRGEQRDEDEHTMTVNRRNFHHASGRLQTTCPG